MSEELISHSFARFALAAHQVGATAKRLEKAAILGAYFAELSDDDLRLAARWLAGYVFPQRDQRTVNIGGAVLLAAILQTTGADETGLRRRLVVLGDMGDVAEEAFGASSHTVTKTTLTLADVAALFQALAATAGTKNKVQALAVFLSRATAREARYMVKLLQGDLRIGLKEGAVEDAVARAAQVVVGQIQWVNMLLGDIGETAVLARHGRLQEAQMALFHPLKFMLATPAADLADVARQMPPVFTVEDKFDGIRAQAHIAPARDGETLLHGVVLDGIRVALFSRTLDEITASFPDLVAPLAGALPPACDGIILDGEIVPIDGARILPFQALQPRLGRKTPASKVQPVAFIAYDVLYAGRSLLQEPFHARRAILEKLSFANVLTRCAASHLWSDVAALDAEFDAARARGNEGLMVKNRDATYKPGRRGREWLKIKRALATLDVVVTAAQVGEGRRSRFLSDYTFAVRTSETDPTLLNVGKAYSGLTDAETQTLSDWCMAHTLAEFAHGKVRTVEPIIVLEITFDRVQASARHKGGYALRFPRILRIRGDKPAAEIDTLDTVRRLAESSTHDTQS